MSLPTLTPEQRAAALEKAAEVRRARAVIKGELKAGELTLADVLGRADAESAIGRMRVRELLTSLPKIGKVKAAGIMREMYIPQTRRVQGMGETQRLILIERLG